MISKKLHIILFLFAALVQLYIPAGMIIEREDVLKKGKEFRFRTAPIDPADPFRGKYVALDFRNNVYEDKQARKWYPNEEIYAEIVVNKDGFAEIAYISKTKPPEYTDFIKVKVLYVNSYNKVPQVNIAFPFDRFYMEETKAPLAEKQYLESLRDTNNVTFALVKIKEGTAVLEDVMINNISLKDLVEKEISK